ncbi:MAG TPA: hypothetical protein VFP56_05995 [Candidatus Limnocylindrales bacterium]|nr:hypothetical protein [Candidatus Limnocylindrales bacterium]
MTADRDMTRLLDAWLADGPMRVSDRAFDEAVGRVYRERQRPAWRFQPWRLPTMSTQLKLVLAGAALLGAMLGATVLFSGGTARPNASAAPSPTASPTTSAQTSLATPIPTLRTFRMEVQGDAIAWTAAVPAGWSDRAWYMTTEVGPAAPTGVSVAATGAVNIPSDPCDGIGKVSVARSSADVVAELEARDDLTVSNPSAATLGGYSGSRIDVEVPADLSACEGDYFLFAEPDGSGFYAQGPSNRLRVWILDVAGRPVIFWIQSFPGTPPADLTEAQEIMNSIVITP